MSPIPIPLSDTDAAYNAALCRDGRAITIPVMPPRALLVSMALRLRRDFTIEQHTIELGAGISFTQGMTPESRESLLTDMERLYEEVVGRGFYKWDGARDAMYLAMVPDIELDPTDAPAMVVQP